MYIRILEALGLARVKKLAPRPRFAAAKPVVDLETLQAVIANRYDVLARYAKSLKQTYAEEARQAASAFSPRDAEVLQAGFARWLHRDERVLPERERATLAESAGEVARRSQTALLDAPASSPPLWERSSRLARAAGEPAPGLVPPRRGRAASRRCASSRCRLRCYA